MSSQLVRPSDIAGDGVAVLTLDRADKKNALSIALRDARRAMRSMSS